LRGSAGTDNNWVATLSAVGVNPETTRLQSVGKQALLNPFTLCGKTRLPVVFTRGLP